MADTEAATRATRNNGQTPVAFVTKKDILLGRGSASNEWHGNQWFRSLVKVKRDEYNSAKRNETKSKIAKDFLSFIYAQGGRFLERQQQQQTNTTGKRRMTCIVTEGSWVEVSEDVALEKCKQAFRQKRGRKKTESSNNASVNNVLDSAPPPSLEKLAAQETSALVAPPALSSYPLPPTLLGSASTLHLLAPHQHPSILQINSDFALQNLARQQHQTCALLSQESYMQCLADTSSILGQGHSLAIGNTHGTVAGVLDPRANSSDWTEDDYSDASSSSSCSSNDKEEAAIALSALAVADRPKITLDEMQVELATLTNDERAAAFSDMFGKHCSLDSTPTKSSKRARRDLDNDSLVFLLRQMQSELEKIPKHKKQALVQAQAKCRAKEFSDLKLIKFLRCEGMNAQLAAQRLVNYWEARKSVFGPDKYVMRMALSDALSDDVAAIEAGVVQLLPHLDSFGRQLVYLVPHRHTGVGYSSESLLRAFWYIMECAAARENNNVVWLAWEPETTIWDFDTRVYNRFIEYEKTCWPVQWIAIHSCCPSSIIMKVMRPVMSALTDKRSRARTTFHDVDENEILDALSEYGMTKDILPTEMGGTVELNQREWIANQLAKEMEEL